VNYKILFLLFIFNYNLHAIDAKLKLVTINSSLDNVSQKAYVFGASEINRPLIVYLHSWDGNYKQKDSISGMSINSNINYIRSNHRGPNTNPKACLSKYVISDIDDSINYMINKYSVDKNNIFVVGGSGGGYTAIGYYQKSKYKIKKTLAYVPITNLVQWYSETRWGGVKINVLSKL
jgi:hypothetical protein